MNRARRKPRTMEQIVRIRCNSANYRAKQLGLDGRLIPTTIRIVPDTCLFCGKRLGVSNTSLDHIIPFSKGGQNTWENVQWTCAKCNRYRGNLSVEEYQEFLKLLADANWTTRFFQHYRPRGYGGR